jgi:hypothetical protein
LWLEERKDGVEKLGRVTESKARDSLLKALSPMEVARWFLVELPNTAVKAGLRTFKSSTINSFGPGCHGLGTRVMRV